MRLPRWLIEVVETLGLTLIVFVVIQSFVAQPFQVRQTSMERTLEPDQYVLVDKLTPRFDPYKRGDVVVLRPANPFPPTTIEEVRGCLKYDGPPVSIEEMHELIDVERHRA